MQLQKNVFLCRKKSNDNNIKSGLKLIYHIILLKNNHSFEIYYYLIYCKYLQYQSETLSDAMKSLGCEEFDNKDARPEVIAGALVNTSHYFNLYVRLRNRMLL